MFNTQSLYDMADLFHSKIIITCSIQSCGIFTHLPSEHYVNLLNVGEAESQFTKAVRTSESIHPPIHPCTWGRSRAATTLLAVTDTKMQYKNEIKTH